MTCFFVHDGVGYGVNVRGEPVPLAAADVDRDVVFCRPVAWTPELRAAYEAA